MWILTSGSSSATYHRVHRTAARIVMARCPDRIRDEMRLWVRAVRSGGSLDNVIPVGVEPTEDHADMLERRLDFIERELLSVPADSLEDAG